MRYIVYGRGGDRRRRRGWPSAHRREVVLIARGRQLEAIRAGGLTLRGPVETARVEPPVVAHPSEVAFEDGDAVLLTVKTQDAIEGRDELRATAGDGVPVICAQNGVTAEREALQRFQRV